MEEVVARDLVPTVYTAAGLEALRRAAVAASRRVDVEVKVDTGMHRVGADLDEARRSVEEVVAAPELSYAGLWTHLAVADEPADPFTAEQLARFEALRSLARGSRACPRRCGCTPPTRRGRSPIPARATTSCAAGSRLYGYLPSRRRRPRARRGGRRRARSAPRSAGRPRSARARAERRASARATGSPTRSPGGPTSPTVPARLRRRGPAGALRGGRRAAHRRPAPAGGGRR